MNYIKKVLIKLLDKILAFSLQRPSSFPLKLADIQIKKNHYAHLSTSPPLVYKLKISTNQNVEIMKNY